MKFSIGDKVLLKQTGEEGVIAAYLGPGMYEVDVAGVVFPVFEDAIDHPYLKWFTEQKKQKKTVVQEPPPRERGSLHKTRLAQGVFLSFMPEYTMGAMEELISSLRIYLINELPYSVRFRYEVRIKEQAVFFHEGTLVEFSHIYLHGIPYEDMNDHPRFHWLLVDADASKGLREKSGVLRIRPAQLFQKVSEIQQKGEPSFNYLLADSFDAALVSHPLSSGIKLSRPPGANRKLSSPFQDLPRYEVDLHIEKIEPDFRQKKLANAEILQIQLEYLQHYLRLAIAHRFERMIVIHGLGRGTLRDAVHQILKDTPEVSRYVNEWMGKYGFGATEVRFKY